MATDEMFESAVRSAGDHAGVFEYDGETGYFYLYQTKGAQGQKVLDAIRVMIGTAHFDESDVVVRWDAAERAVGLFIRGNLWAAFDATTGTKYGGDYQPSTQA